jgi:outer membrane protein OmpA-like peptidoglycan-associated protein/tetratricopeptide (TPR) repeat protein
MIMKKIIFLYITILGLFLSNSYAQTTKITNAEKKYDNYAYIDAIKTYEKEANKGYKSVDLFQKLGNAYYFNSQLDQAEKWYEQLFAMTSEVESEYYFRYAQSLKAVGKDALSNEIMDKFYKLSNTDSRAALFEENKNYLTDIKASHRKYKIQDAGINSIYSDYGSAFFNKKLVFSSSRDTGSLAQRKHAWTNQYFTNLYAADLDDSLVATNVHKFSSRINSKFHEATPVFTKDGKTMYFTRNNFLNGKKGKDDNKVTLIKIYKAVWENDKWENITPLPFNSDQYSTAHPALSPDEKTLYFASDMPGTLGQSDLFKVAIYDDGTYGSPVNLGKEINTEGKETFPFVTDQNELYFASDGHLGLGGLDIFITQINPDETLGDIENIGSDINSPQDDFAFLIDTKTKKGFFSSNRAGGKGYDDIYSFTDTTPLKCEQLIKGKVTDLETKQPIAEAKLTLYDNQFEIIGSTISDPEGHYSFTADCKKSYSIRASKEEYLTKESKITTGTEDKGETNLPFELEKEACKVVIGDDLGKCFGIKMIYFDLNKYNIREEAALDLEKILDVLNENPTMKLDIRSHTDSRASFNYNKKLSDNRAKSTIKWLINNGVDPSRLTGKGYGETELINHCADDVECTEEEHQLNRRSEFIVTDL